MTDAPASGRRELLSRVLRALGIAVALAALAFLVATLVHEWPAVSEAISGARIDLIFLAWLAALGGMWFLALLWLGALRSFGCGADAVEVSAWYFAGEMGKYVPGGIWPIVGRGELASRAGVPRSVAYGTTLLSLGLMVLGGLMLCAALAPFSLTSAEAPAPMYLLLLVLPLGLVLLHPAVVGRVLDLVRRTTRGRVDLQPASWGNMTRLAASSIPTWVLVGLSSWLVARSLGYGADLSRTMLAATLAWVVGFVAVPVPAGAGIREVVFVATSGLGTTGATVVAMVTRFLFVVVDGFGGLLGLAYVRAERVLTDESL